MVEDIDVLNKKPRWSSCLGSIFCAILFVVAGILSLYFSMMLSKNLAAIEPINLLLFIFSISLSVPFFFLSQKNICGIKHLLTSNIFIIIFISLFIRPFIPGITSNVLFVICVASVFLIPSLSGYFAGNFSRRSRKFSNTPLPMLLISIIIPLMFIPCGWAAKSILDAKRISGIEKMRPANLVARAKDLKQTLIVPTLDCPVSEGTNLIWCSTFQVAWNQLCHITGGDIEFGSPNVIVDALNTHYSTTADLDEKTYLVTAGPLKDGLLDSISSDLSSKFNDAISPDLLPPQNLPGEPLAAYCYLSVNLPFEWAFQRFAEQGPMTFRNSEVKGFGIRHYSHDDLADKRAASQVSVFDTKGDDDFIVELTSINKNHHLYLAKIPPNKTFKETVDSVQQRIASSVPDRRFLYSTFEVPILNFDILRNYSELTNKPIVLKKSDIHEPVLAMAVQKIRFSLDERGAVLKSVSMVMVKSACAMMPKDLIFDKPFLIMLQYKDAKVPYFAAWVDNPEILVKAE